MRLLQVLSFVALFPAVAGRFRTKTIHRPTVGIAYQKGTQRAAVGVESFRTFPQTNENVLHHVFGLEAVVQDTPGHAQNDTGMALVQFAERRLVRLGYSDDERCIAGIGEWSHT